MLASSEVATRVPILKSSVWPGRGLNPRPPDRWADALLLDNEDRWTANFVNTTKLDIWKAKHVLSNKADEKLFEKEKEVRLLTFVMI